MYIRKVIEKLALNVSRLHLLFEHVLLKRVLVDLFSIEKHFAGAFSEILANSEKIVSVLSSARR